MKQIKKIENEKEKIKTFPNRNKNGSIDVFSFDLASLKKGGFFMYIMLYNVW